MSESVRRSLYFGTTELGKRFPTYCHSPTSAIYEALRNTQKRVLLQEILTISNAAGEDSVGCMTVEFDVVSPEIAITFSKNERVPQPARDVMNELGSFVLALPNYIPSTCGLYVR